MTESTVDQDTQEFTPFAEEEERDPNAAPEPGLDAPPVPAPETDPNAVPPDEENGEEEGDEDGGEGNGEDEA